MAKRTSERLNGSFSRFFNRGDFPKSLGNRRASLQRSDKTDFFLWPREMDPTNRHSHAARIIIVKYLRCPVSRLGDIFFCLFAITIGSKIRFLTHVDRIIRFLMAINA